MTDGFRTFITESNKKNKKLYRVFNSIDFIIKDELPAHIDVDYVISKVEEKIPEHVVSNIDCFYVGMFREFKIKDVNAMYKDGTVYVTNEQDDNDDMIDDLIHEIAHATEDIYGQQIYADNKIQREFMGKRARLRDLLIQYDLVPLELYPGFLNIEYTKDFDDYLYNDVGEDRLHFFCNGLFVRPYASTGIREYFATAFEEFLLGDPTHLRNLSPQAYKKVYEICMEEV